jgi:hypothetical protein
MIKDKQNLHAASLILLLSFSLIQGCLINSEPYRQNRTFDLGKPATRKVKIFVQRFDNPNACKRSFTYRAGENEIIRDEYNKWAAPPENLIASYLKTTFQNPDESAHTPILSGSIELFEFDLKENKAVFSTAFSIKTGSEKSESRSFISETKFDHQTPDEMTKAMSENLKKFADEIITYLDKGE